MKKDDGLIRTKAIYSVTFRGCQTFPKQKDTPDNISHNEHVRFIVGTVFT